MTCRTPEAVSVLRASVILGGSCIPYLPSSLRLNSFSPAWCNNIRISSEAQRSVRCTIQYIFEPSDATATSTERGDNNSKVKGLGQECPSHTGQHQQQEQDQHQEQLQQQEQDQHQEQQQQLRSKASDRSVRATLATPTARARSTPAATTTAKVKGLGQECPSHTGNCNINSNGNIKIKLLCHFPAVWSIQSHL